MSCRGTDITGTTNWSWEAAHQGSVAGENPGVVNRGLRLLSISVILGPKNQVSDPSSKWPACGERESSGNGAGAAVVPWRHVVAQPHPSPGRMPRPGAHLPLCLMQGMAEVVPRPSSVSWLWHLRVLVSFPFGRVWKSALLGWNMQEHGCL